jgi:phosphate transport system substrate-binding protein
VLSIVSIVFFAVFFTVPFDFLITNPPLNTTERLPQGDTFDAESDLDMQIALEKACPDYKQIVSRSEFKLGDDFKIGYIAYEGEREEDYDDWNEHLQEFGTYPYMDGSTACAPMAIMFARQHLGLDAEQATSFVGFSRTGTAYENLIYKQVSDTDGSLISGYIGYEEYDNDHNRTKAVTMLRNRPVELLLATEPSQDELRMASEAGIELTVEPICKDAFIFIVNADNPVDSLTQEQIRGIYSGKITHWSEVGGENEEIKAFQRTPNSGSQTAMENTVMDGIKMIPAKQAETYSAMSGMVNGVAEYQNGKSSIGYTYKYYLDVLYGNEDVKVLKIDDIAPDADNISASSYPYTTNYCGVIRSEDKDKTAGKFLDWMLSAEGQKVISAAGYVPVK